MQTGAWEKTSFQERLGVISRWASTVALVDEVCLIMGAGLYADLGGQASPTRGVWGS